MARSTVNRTMPKMMQMTPTACAGDFFAGGAGAVFTGPCGSHQAGIPVFETGSGGRDCPAAIAATEDCAPVPDWVGPGPCGGAGGGPATLPSYPPAAGGATL